MDGAAKSRWISWLAAVVVVILSCAPPSVDPPAHRGGAAEMGPRELREAWTPTPGAATLREALEPLHERLGLPQRGEWRATYPEYGQTLGEYRASNPMRATGARRVLYFAPLGPLDDGERALFEAVKEFSGLYYGLPVREAPPLELSAIPAPARRRGPLGTEQLLTTYILGEEMPRRLSGDAAALVAVTASDLWPGQGWYYVFGQSTWHERVAVCSLARLRLAAPGPTGQTTLLRRALKLVCHETGHNFGLHHCALYECLMDGSNHLGELDRHPLEVCPLCLSKLEVATGVEPLDRFRELELFALAHGLEEEALLYRRSALALEALPPLARGSADRAARATRP